MPAAAPAGLFYGCLTHVPLQVAYPDFVSTIRLGEAQVAGALNLRDLAPEWEPYHPILGGMAGTFALKNHVVALGPKVTHVGICQYRKFVSNSRLSRTAAPSYKVMDVVSAAELTPERFAAAMLPGDRPFMVSRPFTLSNWRKRSSYLKQFSSVHHPQDLLRFVAEAVEQGVLDESEVRRFLAFDFLVPGGVELGVYPTDFWVATITSIENIARACVQRYPKAREGYNLRAWAFCSERLGGYLLLRHLREMSGVRLGLGQLIGMPVKTWPEHFIGQLNLITQGNVTDYVIGT